MEDPELINLTCYLSEQEIYSIIDFKNKDKDSQYHSNQEQFELNRIIALIKNGKNKHNIDLFNLIKQQSLQKGGFLNNKYRKAIYLYLMDIEADVNIGDSDHKNSVNNLLVLSNNSNEDFALIESIENEEIPLHRELNKSNQYCNIIKVDTYRSKINTLFPIKYFHDTNILLKQKLHQLTISLANILKGRYNYFQGYHDINLLFLLLFKDDNLVIKFSQRFSEFYLRESLNSKEMHKNFNFLHEMKLISKYVELYDDVLGMEINTHFEDGFFFVTSWLITFFTHNLEDIDKQYRIIDYIICSCPSTIYCLSAVVIVEEYKKFLNSTTEVRMDTLFQYYQNIDYNNYDFEKAFTKCELFKQKLLKSNFDIMQYASFSKDQISFFPRFLFKTDSEIYSLIRLRRLRISSKANRSYDTLVYNLSILVGVISVAGGVYYYLKN